MIRPKDKMRGCDTPAHTSKASLETCAHKHSFSFWHFFTRLTATQGRKPGSSLLLVSAAISAIASLYSSMQADSVATRKKKHDPKQANQQKEKGKKISGKISLTTQLFTAFLHQFLFCTCNTYFWQVLMFP